MFNKHNWKSWEEFNCKVRNWEWFGTTEHHVWGNIMAHDQTDEIISQIGRALQKKE